MNCVSLYDALKIHGARIAALHDDEVKFGRVLDEYDLTFPQFLALVAISDGLATTMGAVSDLSKSSRGNMTGIMDRLDAKGFIRRERSTADRRVVDLRLSGLGINVLDSIKSAAIDETLLGLQLVEPSIETASA